MLLLDELAALDPPHRREVAAALRRVAETFDGVPDPHTAHTSAAGPHARHSV